MFVETIDAFLHGKGMRGREQGSQLGFVLDQEIFVQCVFNCHELSPDEAR
jgi:hypothetical protein